MTNHLAGAITLTEAALLAGNHASLESALIEMAIACNNTCQTWSTPGHSWKARGSQPYQRLSPPADWQPPGGWKRFIQTVSISHHRLENDIEGYELAPIMQLCLLAAPDDELLRLSRESPTLLYHSCGLERLYCGGHLPAPSSNWVIERADIIRSMCAICESQTLNTEGTMSWLSFRASGILLRSLDPECHQSCWKLIRQHLSGAPLQIQEEVIFAGGWECWASQCLEKLASELTSRESSECVSALIKAGQQASGWNPTPGGD